MRYPQPAQPPPGYFELPTNPLTVTERIARLDDALRYACRVRAKALQDGDTTRWQINEASIDQLLNTRSAYMMDLALLVD